MSPNDPDEGLRLQQNPIVNALIGTGSAAPPDSRLLRGYLAETASAETWRLYLNPTLDDFVEIPKSKILHVEELPDYRGNLVWIPADLSLVQWRLSSKKSVVDFLADKLPAFARLPAPVSRPVIPGRNLRPVLPGTTKACWPCSSWIFHFKPFDKGDAQ